MVEKKKDSKKLVSRRDFLVAGGAIIAAGALTACTPKTTTETVISNVTNTKTVTNTATVTAPVQTITVTGAPVTITKTATTTASTTITGAPVTTTITKTVAPATTTLELLNPRGVIQPPKTVGLAPRVTSLAGKTIGLYSIGKQGYAEFLDVLENLLKQKYPTLTVKRYTGSFDLGDKLAATIAKEFDTFIYGSAD
jgi:hypothetical protein